MEHRARLKPNHKAITTYYQALERLHAEGVHHEGAIRVSFHNLLSAVAPRGWVVIAELGSCVERRNVYPDATVRDANSLPRGYWEAKDTDDDLDSEIRKKVRAGYPLTNIIFEVSRTGVLYQGNQEVLRCEKDSMFGSAWEKNCDKRSSRAFWKMSLA